MQTGYQPISSTRCGRSFPSLQIPVLSPSVFSFIRRWIVSGFSVMNLLFWARHQPWEIYRDRHFLFSLPLANGAFLASRTATISSKTVGFGIKWKSLFLSLFFC